MNELIRNYSFGSINVTLKLPCDLICREPFSLFVNDEIKNYGYVCNIKNGGKKLFEFCELYHIHVAVHSDSICIARGVVLYI